MTGKFFIITLISTLLTACSFSEDKLYHGYIEEESVMIAATSSGLLETLSVERGQTVKNGDPLFSLDLTELIAQRDSAIANLERLKAELEDSLKGERSEEIQVVLKKKEQAEALLTNAQAQYNRVLPLHEAGAVSASDLDNAQATLDSAKAQVEELEAQLKTASLGARVDKIKAAKASVAAAEQTLAQTEKKLEDAAPLAPSSGIIEDTFFRPGEYVTAGQPVVDLLPPENIKVRFFVSQKIVAQLKYGQIITVSCDGCSKPIKAKISYIASEAEFTPPVIYSVESRDKLVFLIEAKPEEFSPELRPGLPVDISLGSQDG